MWRAMTRVGLADLRSRPLQTALLGLVIALAAATLTLAATVRAEARAPWDDLMRRTNGAHAWFSGSDRDSIAGAASQPGVRESTPVYPTIQGALQGELGPSPAGAPNTTVYLELQGVETTPPTIGRPLLTAGRWLEGGADEVVLEHGLAHHFGITPGDMITVNLAQSDPFGREGAAQIEDRLVTLTVVGVARVTSTLPFPIWAGQSPAFVLSSTVEAFSGGRPPLWTIGVQLDDAATSSAFIDGATDSFSRPGALRAVDWQSMRDDVEGDTRIFVIFFTIFGSFALGAVALIVANIVSSTVLAANREIGLLKAVGFAPANVTLVFLASQVALALSAAILGVAAGFGIAPLFSTDIAESLGTGGGYPFDAGTFALVLAGVGVLVAVFTALPAWQAGRVPAVQAISRWSVQPTGASRLTAAGSALHLPPVAVTGLKDAFARPVRSWFTVCALAIAVGTLTMTLSIEATLAAGKEDIGMFANEPYHVVAGMRPGADVAAAGAAVAGLDGVASVTEQVQLRATVDGRRQPFILNAASGDLRDYGQKPFKGRIPSQPDEIMVAEPLARRLGLELGSTLVVDVAPAFVSESSDGAPNAASHTLTVTGVYREADEDGQVAITPLTTIEPQLASVSPRLLGIRLDDPDEAKSVAATLRSTLGPDTFVFDEVAENRADLNRAASEARPILFGLNALLILIAVVNVVTTLLFAVRERYRDIGILKTIGFTPGQVFASVATGAVLLAAIATLLGVPAGLWVSETLFNRFGEPEGWEPGIAVTPPAWQLLLVLPAAVLVAVAGSWIPGRRAARLSVTDALRFE